MIVYGIPNCNTVKKALDWLKSNQIAFSFHDYKKQGITKEKLEEWAQLVEWQVLINKKGTTWRQLPAEVQESIATKDAAFDLIIQKPSVTKRPILESKGKIFVGFDEQGYQSWLNQ